MKVPLGEGVICNLPFVLLKLAATMASKWGRSLSISCGLAPDTGTFLFFSSDLSSFTGKICHKLLRSRWKLPISKSHLPFMSSIRLSIFCANATSWGVGGLFLLMEAAGLEAALKVNLRGVWDLDELVGLGAPLELVLVLPGRQLEAALEQLGGAGPGSKMGN